MKWIAVILVLLNVVAYLLGMRAPVNNVQSVQSGEYEQINVAAMSVIRPEEARDQQSSQTASDAATVEEDSLAELKVDQRGRVLMAKTAQSEDKQPQAQNATPPIEADPPTQKHDAPAAEQKKDVPVDIKKQVDAPQAETPVETASTKQLTTAPAAAEPALMCYRLGPFKNPKRLTSLRQKLDSQGVAYKLDEREATRRIKAVRVYIGPYGKDSALEAQKQQLEKLNIDHFPIRLKGKRLLQLGYFSEPARATNYQKLMQTKGLPVKTETIYLDGTINNSIELAQISEAAVKALDISKGVNIETRPCQ